MLRLDAYGQNTLRNDPECLAAWRSASRVQRLPRRGKPDASSQDPAPVTD